MQSGLGPKGVEMRGLLHGEAGIPGYEAVGTSSLEEGHHAGPHGNHGNYGGHGDGDGAVGTAPGNPTLASSSSASYLVRAAATAPCQCRRHHTLLRPPPPLTLPFALVARHYSHPYFRSFVRTIPPLPLAPNSRRRTTAAPPLPHDHPLHPHHPSRPRTSAGVGRSLSPAGARRTVRQISREKEWGFDTSPVAFAAPMPSGPPATPMGGMLHRMSSTHNSE